MNWRRQRQSVRGWGAAVGLGALVAAAGQTYGPWWALPLLAAALAALLAPGRPALAGMAAALALVACTGLPAAGRQPVAVSVSLGLLAVLAGWSWAAQAQAARPGGTDRRPGAATGPAPSPAGRGGPAAAAVGLAVAAAAVLAAVWQGALQIVPWIEASLGLGQAAVVLGVITAVRAGRPGAGAWIPLLMGLAALAPTVWLLFLSP